MFYVKTEILITDAAGKPVTEIKVQAAGKEYSLDTKTYHLAPGTYFMTVISSSEKVTQSMIITD